jgi:NADPH:quinone reductase-like Zn-dependent oxidoreductase
LLVRTEALGVGLGLLRMLRAQRDTGSAPVSPGGEMVGTVTAVGEGVTGYGVGDRVGGVVFDGLYAESVLALPALVSPVPEDVPAAAALALVRGGLVALGALRAGELTTGRSVLVTGAASGVGHLAVQLARAAGAERVVAAVGPTAAAEKAELLRGLGADAVVRYPDEDWGAPVDLVLDGVGGDLVQRGVDLLAPHGRLVAFSAGGGSVDAGSLLGGLKTVTGFSVGLLSRERPELLGAYREELWRFLADGRLRPVTAGFGFAELDRALALVAARANLGRVVLLP